MEKQICVDQQVWILSPDGREFITCRELRIRRVLEAIYRFCLSVFCSAHLFDFLFSPIWMHGYIWSLNNPLGVDLNEKSAGEILDMQLRSVGYGERLFHAVFSTLSVVIILRLVGFHKTNRTVWQLLRLSMACGAVSGISRTIQMKHRLYSAIHESFFVYLQFFIVGYCMTGRILERFNKEPDAHAVQDGDVKAKRE